MLTFSILDSWNVALKLGVDANPLLQTNIFLRRKYKDFFPIALFLTSLHLPRIILIVRSMSESRSTSKLEGQFRNSSNGKSAVVSSAFEEVDFCLKSLVSSFCRLLTSSAVNSEKSGDEDSSSRGISVFRLRSTNWDVSSLHAWSVYPNVPIASNPLGQSLNSSLGVSLLFWSAQCIPSTMIS